MKPPITTICYVDETGDEFVGNANSGRNLFAVVGLLVKADSVQPLLADFLDLKTSTYGQLKRVGIAHSDLISFEIKGSRLRRAIRHGGRKRRGAEVFLERVLSLLENHDVRFALSMKVVDEGARLPRDIYAASVLELVNQSAHHLGNQESSMLMILDSRTQSKNVPTVHRIAEAIFSGKLSSSLLLEVPVFGHSTSHGLLQLADAVVSGIVATAFDDQILKSDAQTFTAATGIEALLNRLLCLKVP